MIAQISTETTTGIIYPDRDGQQATQRAEQAEQLAEKLAAKLRELGIDPNDL
jgi:hypothetical protein